MKFVGSTHLKKTHLKLKFSFQPELLHSLKCPSDVPLLILLWHHVRSLKVVVYCHNSPAISVDFHQSFIAGKEYGEGYSTGALHDCIYHICTWVGLFLRNPIFSLILTPSVVYTYKLSFKLIIFTLLERVVGQMFKINRLI